MVFFETLVAAAAAVILFIYGIDHLSMEFQHIASGQLRIVLAKLTSNKWIGALLGALTTTIIQSSSATSVIIIGLVNSNIITFSQSLGVIAGANIGTTITAQLVAFNLIEAGPIILITGFLTSLFGGKYKIFGKSIFYFGLVFFSLNLISNMMEPLKVDPTLLKYISELNNPLYALLFGIIITLLFQSSTVTTGVAVLFGAQGLISLHQAIPLVFGANIGTTTTALLAVYRLDAFAKKTAYAHLVFNFLGVLIFFPFLEQFEALVNYIGGDSGKMIANAHTLFNVGTAIIFLLLVDNISKFLTKLVKSKEKEIVFRTKYIRENEKILQNTEEALALVRKELGHELEYIKEQFSISLKMIRDADASALPRTVKLEALSDYLDDRISEVLAQLSRRKLSELEAKTISRLTRISNEIEQLADMGENLSRIAQRLDEKGLKLLPESIAELSVIETLFFENLELLKNGMDKFSKNDLNEMVANERKIATDIEHAYLNHIKRLKEERPSEFAGTHFTDIMATLESANHKIVSIMKQLRAIS